MRKEWTLAELLAQPPQDESLWVASYVLDRSPGQLRAAALRGETVSAEAAEDFFRICKERESGKPLQYAIGRWNFYGRDFRVDERALIPRPETERLVEWALDWVQRRPKDRTLRAIDVGTGTGCIAITLALEAPSMHVTGVDCSPAALQLAKENAQCLAAEAADRLAWREGDLLQGLAGGFDLIVSNPPYVGESERGDLSEALAWEPEEALFAGLDGLAVYRRLLPQARKALAPGGALFLEIGATQGEAVETLLREAGFVHVCRAKDWTGRERMVCAEQEDLCLRT